MKIIHNKEDTTKDTLFNLQWSLFIYCECDYYLQNTKYSVTKTKYLVTLCEIPQKSTSVRKYMPDFINLFILFWSYHVDEQKQLKTTWKFTTFATAGW